MSIFNNNTKSRLPLDYELKTIKFKIVFPTFEIWKYWLIKNKIKPSWIKESHYILIKNMIFNSYLKYTTSGKTINMTSYYFNKFYLIMERENQLYDRKIDNIVSSKSENEQTLYTINRTDADIIIDDYIDNKVKSKIINNEPIINKLDMINKFINMENPELKFIERLASSITLELQPNRNGALW